MRRQRAAIARECLLITRRRFGKPLHLHEQIAKRHVGRSVIALERGGLRKMRRRVVEPAERPQRQRQIEMRFRVAGLHRQRAADQFHGNIEAPGLERDDAEEMLRIKMVRLDGQNIAAALLRFGQSPPAQVVDRCGEQVAGERAGPARARQSERARRPHRRFAMLAGGAPVLAVHAMPSR